MLAVLAYRPGCVFYYHVIALVWVSFEIKRVFLVPNWVAWMSLTCFYFSLLVGQFSLNFIRFIKIRVNGNDSFASDNEGKLDQHYV